MVKCRNCYNWKICSELRVPGYGLKEYCSLYKDKALIKELPCSEGTTVYLITTRRNNGTGINFTKVIETEFTLALIEQVGKTVFLTEEEAKRVAYNIEMEERLYG